VGTRHPVPPVITTHTASASLRGGEAVTGRGHASRRLSAPSRRHARPVVRFRSGLGSADLGNLRALFPARLSMVRSCACLDPPFFAGFECGLDAVPDIQLAEDLLDV
jgi:hypothetical protein